jgi:LmbE family N-acetylglucosaminyl deacetylase
MVLISISHLGARICQSYRWALSHIGNEYREDDMRRPAIVFSPHFDDETLGCGGTIIKKKRAGADVKIVFMTDGSKSHRHLIAEDELKAIRASEGLAASRLLGLDAGDVFLLGFEETMLCEHVNIATDRIIKILMRHQPDEIFIPYYRELPLWSEDHLATNKIVLSALQKYGRKVVIYEYPIWFWPWTNVPINNHRVFLTILKNTFITPWNLLMDFLCFVYIGDVLEHKRSALDQHRSQMTRLIPDPDWLTLGDVSSGKFLESFFQEHEVFHRYNLPNQ